MDLQRRYWVGLPATLLLFACGVEPGTSYEEAALSHHGAVVNPDTTRVVQWNQIAINTTQQGEPIIFESRSVAMTQLAVFDALNAIDPQYASYALRHVHKPHASPGAAIAAAAHDTLLALYPYLQAQLDSEYADALSSIPNGSAKTDGVALGQQAAQAILTLRTGDGIENFGTYTAAPAPGVWQPTPGDGIAQNMVAPGPDFIPALRPAGGAVKTFLITSGSQFRPGPPPSLTSAAYAQDLAEIEDLGSGSSTTRTAAQTNTALMWWATSNVMWNQPAQQMVVSNHYSPVRAAHAFALLNAAIADGLIMSFDAKFTYNQWRPISAIRGADTDGNPATTADPTWAPLMWTPPFPDYPSAHSVAAGTAYKALKNIFGPHAGSFTMSNPVLPSVVGHYASFDQAIDEVIEARIWAGAHFRTSDEVGVDMGLEAGDYFLEHSALGCD